MKRFKFLIKYQVFLIILTILFTVIIEWFSIYYSFFDLSTRTNPHTAFFLLSSKYNPFIEKRLNLEKEKIQKFSIEFNSFTQKLDNDFFIDSDYAFLKNKSTFREYLIGYITPLIETLDIKSNNSKDFEYRIRILSDSAEVIVDNHDLIIREDIFRKASAISDSQYEEIFGSFIKNDDFFVGHDYYDSIFYPENILTGQEIIDAKNNGYGIKIRRSLEYHDLFVIYSAMPIYINNNIEGYVLISKDFYSMPSNFLEWSYLLLCFSFFSFIISLPLVIFLLYRLVKPLTNLSKQTKQIMDKKGCIVSNNLYAANRNDEIGDLSRAFSSLIANINNRIHYIETFSSDIAHEFKNPLTAIRTSIELIDNQNLSEQDKRDVIINANEEIKHLELLLNSIRNISKIENENDDEDKKLINIPEITENVIKRIKINYPKVHFELMSTNKNIMLLIKPENFDRLMENLIDNAASFAINSENKKVIVLIQCEKINDLSTLNISIEDSGIGVTPGEETKIFKRFYSHRVDEQRKTHSGLGLSTVKAIVDSLDGKIEVLNGNVLGGANFIISIPLHNELEKNYSTNL